MSGYIGTQPVPQATQTRDSFTATSGQTSFATGGYTPNFLDVYLNGVKLAAADYTATNGSDVVLASGASTGDILEVVAFTTFTPADLPAGTPSIDDNGNATALTINSSESVLVGKSVDTLATSGTALFANGQIDSSVDGNYVAKFNRKTSDGTIIELRKDTTGIVGSIGTGGGGINFNSQGSDFAIRRSGTDVLYVGATASYPGSDNSKDLGVSSFRWKDAYLSGGVYLGGTGSANKLDDVETGTFSPALSGSGGNNAFTMTVQDGHYSKIGTSVTVYFRVGWSTKNGSGGYTLLTGLPFTAKPNSGSFYYLGSTDNTQTTATIGVEGNATQAIFINSSGGLVANSSVANSSGLIACVTYISTS